MDLSQFIKSSRDFINITMRFMPLFLAASMIVFGLISANYSMLLVWLGMYVLVPLAVIILAFIAGKIRLPLFKDVGDRAYSFFQGVAFSEQGTATPYVSNSILVFFFAYLFFNGLSVYQDQEQNPNDMTKTKNRIKGVIGMVGSILLLGLVFLFKYRQMGFSEKPVAFIVLFPAIIGLAYGWNDFLRSCASSNDLYGAVSNKFAPQTSKICVASAV
jgi:hypothetical protein